MADSEADNMSTIRALVEATIEVRVAVDARDIVRSLANDELVLTFICEALALSDSQELRERLAERLADWSDEEYI